jgi:hypothetical protein
MKIGILAVLYVRLLEGWGISVAAQRIIAGYTVSGGRR